MNKMDFSMAANTDEQGKPENPLVARLKKFAVYAAPFLVILGGVALVAILIITGPKPKEKDKGAAPPAVQFAVAHARPASISVNVQGEARPRVEATLAAQAAGRIVWSSPAFVAGGAFRQGDTLARIDDADYRLAMIRTNAQVAGAQEALAREEAESELARQDWQALGRGEPTPLAAREPQLAQARAALASAQASLRSAELDLARTNIRAPFTGRLRERRANVGDYVGPGTPVAVMFSTDAMEIRVPLTDSDLASLRTPVGFSASAARAGPPAHVSVVSGGRIRTWEGRLVRTEATVDARTRLVYGVIQVPDPFDPRHAAPLAPGMFVTARIDGSSRESLVAAPRSALKRNEYVYVVLPDNTIDVRQVRPAQTTADEVLFREGVAEGERLVVSVLAAPRDGMRVTPIDREGAAAPAAQPAAEPTAPAQENLELRQ